MPPGEMERTGELLVEEGVVLQEELTRGLAEAGLKGSALAQLLEATPHVRRADLAAFLASDFRVPAIEDLRKLDLPADAAKLVPEAIARKHEVVPVARLGDVLCVVKANYFNRAAVQELRRATGLKIKVLQADEAQVHAAVEAVYGGRTGPLPGPAGSPKRRDTATRAAAAPVQAATSDLEEVMSLDMISPAAAEPAVAAVAAVRAAPAPAGDDVIEVLDAIRIPSQEYVTAGRNPLSRVVIEFEDLFVTGKPSSPGRFS